MQRRPHKFRMLRLRKSNSRKNRQTLHNVITVRVRLRLNGRYSRYEIVGFQDVAETQLIYKVCGSTRDSESGFEEKRETAFGMMESGVKSGGSSFYTGRYQPLHVLGQCDGDLGNDDCGDCVQSAEEQAKSEHGDSISAQIYLHECYIRHRFCPSEVPP